MATTINAEPLSLSCNAFLTVEDADKYFEDRVHSEAWSNIADETDKAKALIKASSLLSFSYVWAGRKVAELQKLAFPRYDVVSYDGNLLDYRVFPYKLIAATAEMAMLLSTSTGTADSPLNYGITELKVGSITINFSKNAILSGSGQLSNGIPSEIYSMFSEYVKYGTTKGPHNIDLIRV